MEERPFVGDAQAWKQNGNRPLGGQIMEEYRWCSPKNEYKTEIRIQRSDQGCQKSEVYHAENSKARTKAVRNWR
jgi:hypothetical protein